MPIHSSNPHRRAAPSPEEVEVLRVAARAAEDAGDFRGALRLVRRLPESGPTWRWMRQLDTVIALPEDAPERSAWLVHPAVRWARERPAGELLERYAQLLLMTLGLLGAEREMFLGRVASTDPVVLDAGLFDGGLFARYLDEALDPQLLSRAGPLARWPEQPPSVWRVEEQRDDAVLVCDLWSLELTCALPWPAAVLLERGTLIFGRLVPVPGPLGRAFALPPIRVDQRCAVRLLRARRRGADPDERLRAVARFRRRAREIAAAA